jgi:SagB-type dehydrogenase family enzyme
MRIQSSRALLAKPNREGWLVFNFLRKSAVLCSPEAVAWLERLDDWASLDDLTATMAADEASRNRKMLMAMLEADLLVAEGSTASRIEAEFLAKWKWGIAAAALHCATLNCEFMSLEESAAEQVAKLRVEPQPELVKPNGPGAVTLPPPGAGISTAGLLPTMIRRRTNRVPASTTITLQQLGDCLYAGLAITGSVQTPAGVLPLSITPSGGARNPYEAYVYVSAVEGLRPGFYHYAGAGHSLEMVSTTVMERPEAMLAGQDWVHTMPAIILLVAHFERTMWKYQDANSYRVILIEAGHIGQNIMLAATAHGLSACPTAALHHETICGALGISDCLHVPIYALTLSLSDEASA